MVVIRAREHRIHRDGGQTRSDFKLIVGINQRYVDSVKALARGCESRSAATDTNYRHSVDYQRRMVHSRIWHPTVTAVDREMEAGA
jgi:hypothetical protein